MRAEAAAALTGAAASCPRGPAAAMSPVCTGRETPERATSPLRTPVTAASRISGGTGCPGPCPGGVLLRVRRRGILGLGRLGPCCC